MARVVARATTLCTFGLEGEHHAADFGMMPAAVYPSAFRTGGRCRAADRGERTSPRVCRRRDVSPLVSSPRGLPLCRYRSAVGSSPPLPPRRVEVTLAARKGGSERTAKKWDMFEPLAVGGEEDKHERQERGRSPSRGKACQEQKCCWRNPSEQERGGPRSPPSSVLCSMLIL